MHKSIFITVRTRSTRLPRKALLEIQGYKTIEYVIRRQKYSRRSDSIILCTTTNNEDDVLCEIAEQNGIGLFRGSENDKLERWRGAAEKFSVDAIVTADGDDLFCEPSLVDLAFEQLEAGGADFIQATGLVCGAFTYGLKTTALKKVCQIKDTDETEMMWVYFTDSGLFRVAELQNVPRQFYRNDIRMTLDYPEDLQFFQEVLAKSDNREYLPLAEIIRIIDKFPDIKNINFFRQGQFLENQKKKTHLDLKVGDTRVGTK